MSEDQYTVRCEWDLDARVWVATSDDVPGLATGADTLDELFEKLMVVIPELLEANGLLKPDQQGDIPFAIIAGVTSRRRVPRDGGELHSARRESCCAKQGAGSSVRAKVITRSGTARSRSAGSGWVRGPSRAPARTIC